MLVKQNLKSVTGYLIPIWHDLITKIVALIYVTKHFKKKTFYVAF